MPRRLAEYPTNPVAFIDDCLPLMKEDAPRLLGTHDGIEGRAYRRAYYALAEEYGNLQQIERLARRQGLAAASYSQALDKLRELTAAARRQQPPPPEVLRGTPS